MAFKPNKQYTPREGAGEFRELPVPKEGARKGRVSLIVDLGTQNREDFVDNDTGETRPQKPSQQVAVFVDLTADKVDYGGDIGVQPYRIPLNRVFAGKFEGINFKTLPPKDDKGNLIKGKPWTLPGASVLTKLCKAVGMPHIAVEDRSNPESLDLELLLNKPVMVQVEVKVSEKEVEGQKRTYKNVNMRGLSQVPTTEDDDGNEVPLPVPPLACEPKCITFSNAKKEDIKFIRYNIREIIKKANDYAGSNMQKAIEAYEAEQVASNGSEKQEQPEPVAAKTTTKASVTKIAKPKAPVDDSDVDADSIPF